MGIASRIAARLRRFGRDEGGVISAYSLFLVASSLGVGAAAVDVTHLYTARTHLQISADIAAHAALYNRNLTGVPVLLARQRALEAVEFGMPEEVFGTVMTELDIEFGSWDAENETFTQDEAQKSAVLVRAGREEGRDNPVTLFLFRVFGLREMDVETESVFATYKKTCPRDGLMSRVNVNLQSNNGFFRGVCMYAPVVELNSNNSFETGTAVMLPDKDRFLLDNQASTFDSNPGLEDALQEGWFDFYILERLKDPSVANLRENDLPLNAAIVSSLLDTPENPTERPTYIDRSLVGSVIALNPGKLSVTDFTPGRVHYIDCQDNSTGTGAGSGNRINLQTGTYSRFILLTDCAVRMDGMVALEEVIISTTSTAATSIRLPSGTQHGLRLGRNDGCAAGGDSRIFTRGGVATAAKLEIYGSQILALGDVSFAAGSGNATNQAEGLSIIAGGTIQGTSNMSYSGCPNDTNGVFETTYFHAVW